MKLLDDETKRMKGLSPRSPALAFKDRPERLQMVFFPCFTQHDDIKSIFEQFIVRCESAQYCSLVQQHLQQAHTFVILKEGEEQKPVIQYRENPNYLCLSLCNGDDTCSKCNSELESSNSVSS